MVQFESLPNEIVLDFFKYFDIIHLFHAFHGLNARFDTLLYKLHQAYHLNFQCISKQDFDTICQQNLLSIVDRVVSLHLSESDKTPGLPKLFLSRGFTFSQFIHLRSLTLYDIDSNDLSNILCEIHHLKYLIHLNISYCYFLPQEESTPYFWNQIWALPKLKQLNLKSNWNFDIDFTRLTVTSTALENLSIKTTNARSFSDMIYLFQFTPYLQTLSVGIKCKNLDEISSIVFTSITTLNLVFNGAPHALNNLFQNMPNLYHLTIEMRDCYLTGHEWKQILINHLPKIKVFRFKMCITFFGGDDGEERVDEALSTFRSPFWIDEHQWFVRCDWDPKNSRTSNSFYSLPYAFDTFTSISNGRSKWTSPDDRREHWSFNRVRHFMCKTSVNEHLNLHPIRFPKLHQLFISHPVHEQIGCIIPTFNYLTSLRIAIHGNDESDLQILFDRAPHLYELIIDDPHKHDLRILSRLTSTSVRRLYFYASDRDFFPQNLDDEDCTTLAGSSLGRQCEILSGIHVQSITNVINLVNTMGNLRALTINCKLQKLPPTTAIFIKWLQSLLSTRCLISSCSIYQDCARIKLWIG